MHDLPADSANCWIIRIGQPEKPFKAIWNEGNLEFIHEAYADAFAVPLDLVLKWRLQEL
jgi:hypothetical protein